MSDELTSIEPASDLFGDDGTDAPGISLRRKRKEPCEASCRLEIVLWHSGDGIQCPSCHRPCKYVCGRCHRRLYCDKDCLYQHGRLCCAGLCTKKWYRKCIFLQRNGVSQMPSVQETGVFHWLLQDELANTQGNVYGRSQLINVNSVCEISRSVTLKVK